jgi:ligand-binding sensor domain-containing protein
MQVDSVLIAFSLLVARSTCSTPHDGETAAHASQSDQGSAKAIGHAVAELEKPIFSVFQAKDGTYWFGSNGQGLYRYDGSTLTQFTTQDGLCSDWVRGIQEDESGNLYICAGNDISKFDGRRFSTLVAEGDGTAWRLDPEDLWFSAGQDTGAVYRYDGETLHRLKFPATPAGDEHYAKFPRSQFPRMKFSPYDVYTIFKDSRGNVWFGTGGLGVCRYDGKSFAWIPVAELGFDIVGDASFGVRSIAEDKDGKLIFTNVRYRFDVYGRDADGPDSIDLVDLREQGFRIGPENGEEEVFMSMLTDEQGDLWMAALGGGVWRYDGQHVTHYPVRYDDKDIWVFLIYRDRQGGLWLGTHEHGVYKFNGTAFEPFKFSSESR